MRTTLLAPVSLDGIGLHTGAAARVTLNPAAAGQGILFVRRDLGGPDATIPALWDRVQAGPLATRIANAAGVSVSTIEHLMAALAGLGITDLTVAVDGPELPILDGSAAPFARAILATGLRRLNVPRTAIRILRPVQVAEGDAWARLDPATTVQVDFEIEFPDAAIGHQRKSLNLANGAFLRELCDSRTFCRQADVARMQAQGLAQGGTLANAVVVDGAAVLNPGGLRHADEPVRHKMLDALGDLYTAGAPILGRYSGFRAGHMVTNRLLRALFADRRAWARITCDQATEARLPGAGVTLADLASVA